MHKENPNLNREDFETKSKNICFIPLNKKENKFDNLKFKRKII